MNAILSLKNKVVCKFTVNRGLGGFSPLENLRILGIELQKSMLFAV